MDNHKKKLNLLLAVLTEEKECWPWNNGKEVPRWGVAEIQKMSPSTTGICSRHTADQWERGTATRQSITGEFWASGGG